MEVLSDALSALSVLCAEDGCSGSLMSNVVSVLFGLITFLDRSIQI